MFLRPGSMQGQRFSASSRATPQRGQGRGKNESRLPEVKSALPSPKKRNSFEMQQLFRRQKFVEALWNTPFEGFRFDEVSEFCSEEEVEEEEEEIEKEVRGCPQLLLEDEKEIQRKSREENHVTDRFATQVDEINAFLSSEQTLKSLKKMVRSPCGSLSVELAKRKQLDTIDTELSEKSLFLGERKRKLEEELSVVKEARSQLMQESIRQQAAIGRFYKIKLRDFYKMMNSNEIKYSRVAYREAAAISIQCSWRASMSSDFVNALRKSKNMLARKRFPFMKKYEGNVSLKELVETMHLMRKQELLAGARKSVQDEIRKAFESHVKNKAAVEMQRLARGFKSRRVKKKKEKLLREWESLWSNGTETNAGEENENNDVDKDNASEAQPLMISPTNEIEPIAGTMDKVCSPLSPKSPAIGNAQRQLEDKGMLCLEGIAFEKGEAVGLKVKMIRGDGNIVDAKIVEITSTPQRVRCKTLENDGKIVTKKLKYFFLDPAVLKERVVEEDSTVENVKERVGDWEICFDEDGNEFYFNEKLNFSRWQMPAEVAATRKKRKPSTGFDELGTITIDRPRSAIIHSAPNDFSPLL